MPRSRPSHRWGFTLSQVRTTLAAALILMLLFMGPAWLVRLYGSGSTAEHARAVSCASNLKMLSLAFAQYAADNDNCYPPYANHAVPSKMRWYVTDKYRHAIRVRQPHPELLVKTLMPYTKTDAVWFCPDDPLARNNNLTGKGVVGLVSADHRYGSYMTEWAFANYPATPNGFEMIDSRGNHFIWEGGDASTRPLLEEEAIQDTTPRNFFRDLTPGTRAPSYLYSHNGQLQSVAQDGHIMRVPLPR